MQKTIHAKTTIDSVGFGNLRQVHWNLPMANLVQEAIARKEGLLAKDGPLVVKTGIHTGRSAGDKFVVRDAIGGETHLVGQQQGDDASALRCAP
jgi:ATP-dependent phosphoenolpyruvate carboxykinase